MHVPKAAVIVWAGALLLALPLSALAQLPGFPNVEDDTELHLALVPVGPAGSSAVFFVRSDVLAEVGERTGVFAYMDEAAFGGVEQVAVRAWVQVLSVEVNGTARVLVRAQPVDPVNRLPLSDQVWQGVYWLGGDEAVLETGDEPPEQYADLASPTWLVYALETPLADRPGPTLRPGDEWRSLVLGDYFEELEELGLVSGGVPIVGKFVGWADVAELGTRAAYLVETFSGAGTIEGGMGEPGGGSASYQVEGENHVWLIPGDFPHIVYSKVSAQMHVRIEGAPPQLEGELEGEFEVTVSAERFIEREADGQLLEWVAPDYPVIAIGETVAGWLGEGSEDFGDGTYANYYMMYGDEGDEVAITLAADEFDAYLVLLDRNFEMVAWGDDMDDTTTDALVRVALPYSGLYYIVANAYYPETGGHYTLSVQREATSAGGVDVVDLISVASGLLPSLEDVRSMSDEDLYELEDVLTQLLELICDEQDRRLWQ